MRPPANRSRRSSAGPHATDVADALTNMNYIGAEVGQCQINVPANVVAAHINGLVAGAVQDAAARECSTTRTSSLTRSRAKAEVYEAERLTNKGGAKANADPHRR
jgi:hypothetical protein